MGTTNLKETITYVNWKCDAHVYYNYGSIWNTTIKAHSEEELKRLKEEFVETHTIKGNVELIAFGSHVQDITIIYKSTDKDVILVPVDEMKNEYISSHTKERLKNDCTVER